MCKWYCNEKCLNYAGILALTKHVTNADKKPIYPRNLNDKTHFPLSWLTLRRWNVLKITLLMCITHLLQLNSVVFVSPTNESIIYLTKLDRFRKDHSSNAHVNETNKVQTVTNCVDF